VHAVEGGDPSLLEQPRHLLIGEDHQPLDQAMRFGLGDRPRRGDTPVRVEAELRLARLDLERFAAIARQRGSGRTRDRQRLLDRVRRRLAAGEDMVELVVVEPGVGADPAAIEARRPRDSIRSQHDLRGDRQTLHPWGEAACAVAESRWQHRLDRPGNVDAVRPARGLDVEP
jgi:hypothetical protein